MIIKDFFCFWHPKLALRYLPVVKEITKDFKSGDSVLEIGSGAIGIVPYLQKSVIGLDKDFSGKSHPLLKEVKGDALSLPFAGKSFDFVISVDVLEHLKSQDRQHALAEWLRVTKKKLILLFPEGEKAEKQDRELFTRFKSKKCLDRAEVFFQEHLANGLPRIENVKTILEGVLKEKKRHGKIAVSDNLNLVCRWFLMTGWMTNNFFVDLFFRKIMLFFIPVLRLFNQPPVYRKMVVVDLTI